MSSYGTEGGDFADVASAGKAERAEESVPGGVTSAGGTTNTTTGRDAKDVQADPNADLMGGASESAVEDARSTDAEQPSVADVRADEAHHEQGLSVDDEAGGAGRAADDRDVPEQHAADAIAPTNSGYTRPEHEDELGRDIITNSDALDDAAFSKTEHRAK